jgi:hypothetical protein
MTATNVTPARSISVAYVWRIWCGTMRALIPAAVATSRRALRSLRGNMYMPRDPDRSKRPVLGASGERIERSRSTS